MGKLLKEGRGGSIDETLRFRLKGEPRALLCKSLRDLWSRRPPATTTVKQKGVPDFPTRLNRCGLYIKQEVYDVAVLHNVLFTLTLYKTLFLSCSK